MGVFFWKGIENSGFRERADGDWDFFPSGVLGRGYRVTATQREDLQKMLRRQYGVLGVVLLPAIVVQAFFPGFVDKLMVIGAAMLLLAPVFWYFRAQRLRIIGGAPAAERRMTLGEAQQTTAEHIPRVRMILLLVLGPLMTLMGVFVLWIGLRDDETEAMLIGILCIVFFGFCSWVGLRIWLKRRRFLAAGGHTPKVFD